MTSVFEGRKTEMFIYRKVTLQFRDKLMGGIPKNAKVIEGWLRTKAMITDEEELRQVAMRTMRELGAGEDTATYEDVVAAADAMAAERNLNGFKRDDKGLYIEGRIIKAMLKENVNIIWPKGRKGPSKKGAKNYAAERIFVVEDRVYVERDEPDGVELQIGHVSGPQGQRSTLTNIEYIERPTVTFTIKEMVAAPGKDEDPSFSDDEWANIWMSAEENGLGASRSYSHGRFDVVGWEVVTP